MILVDRTTSGDGVSIVTAPKAAGTPKRRRREGSARRQPRAVSLVLITALWLSSVLAAAAQAPDPWSSARWHFGPLAVTPIFEISNLGVDTNVFNSVTDPKKDFTFTAGPRADWWLHFGAGQFKGTSVVDVVYFSTYASERAVNHNHRVTFEYPFNRLKPYAGVSFLSTNDRPGYEIDARARHTESAYNAGAELRIMSRTRLALGATQTVFRFTGDQAFQGSYLNQLFNRTSTSFNATVRHALTPLTTITVQADLQRERFQHSPGRDNDGFPRHARRGVRPVRSDLRQGVGRLPQAEHADAGNAGFLRRGRGGQPLLRVPADHARRPRRHAATSSTLTSSPSRSTYRQATT